jgi:hypothetical protein
MKLVDYVGLYPSASGVLLAFLAVIITINPPTTMTAKVWWISIFIILAISGIGAIVWQGILQSRIRDADKIEQAKQKKISDSTLTQNILDGVNTKLKPYEIHIASNMTVSSNKELLNYMTGGKKMVRLIPSPGAIQPDSKVELTIYNQSKYPQYDISVEISNNFKYQLIMKDRDKMTSAEYFDRVNKESSFMYKIKELEPEGRIIVYTTNLPNELTEGFLKVWVKSRNGSYDTEVKYKRDGNFGWDLLNIKDYYHDFN